MLCLYFRLTIRTPRCPLRDTVANGIGPAVSLGGSPQILPVGAAPAVALWVLVPSWIALFNIQGVQMRSFVLAAKRAANAYSAVRLKKWLSACRANRSVAMTQSES
jgi:hypothetical protein